MGYLQEKQSSRRAEEYILKELSKEYGECKLTPETSAYEYDIMLPNGKTVEVKYDKKSRFTGNVAFEFSQNGDEPSGIMLGSDYWVHIFYDEGEWYWAFAATSAIRNLAFTENVGISRSETSDFYLVRKALFTRLSYIDMHLLTK